MTEDQKPDLSGPARRRRRRLGAQTDESGEDARGTFCTKGGQFAPLRQEQLKTIHQAALRIMSEIGLSGASEQVLNLILPAGGTLSDEGRVLIPNGLVQNALSALARPVTLCGQVPLYDLQLGGDRIYAGSGGAAPMVLDPETEKYRPSTLKDLYDAARLVDRLEHVAFFSRSMVARDMDEPRAVDINTAFVSLAGTTKHVMVSASHVDHVEEIAQLCFDIAGGAEAFRARPFLSLNINHVVPPLRYDEASCDVLIRAVRLGLPAMVNTFGQMGASSPVTIAGCLAQTHAETLAGVVLAWLAHPDARVIYGARPMVTDLRTGGMAGGSGEQALLTAGAVQLARYCGMPNSTIAGATDSKTADVQAGYEKALSVSLAAQAGANMITQAAGMQAGLMGCSFTAYVADNDMLGAVLRATTGIEVNDTTLAFADMSAAVHGEGHFLGQAETYRRMKSDFTYPEIADRRSVEDWEADGAMGMHERARMRAQDILKQHFPSHISKTMQKNLRSRYDIRLSLQDMEMSWRLL